MYQQRKIEPYPRLIIDDFYWKRYAISSHPDVQLNKLLENAEKKLSLHSSKSLLEPNYGTGFMIVHAGLDMDFVVCCYWLNVNELMLKVFKSNVGNSDALELADINHSSAVCVWDLTVIQYEKDALIKHILTPDTPDIEAYRTDQLDTMF